MAKKLPEHVLNFTLGYIKGAMKAGKTDAAVRHMVEEDFPYLEDDQIEVLIRKVGEQRKPPPPKERILS